MYACQPQSQSIEHSLFDTLCNNRNTALFVKHLRISPSEFLWIKLSPCALVFLLPRIYRDCLSTILHRFVSLFRKVLAYLSLKVK